MAQIRIFNLAAGILKVLTIKTRTTTGVINSITRTSLSPGEVLVVTEYLLVV
jgi:hypothetical protein